MRTALLCLLAAAALAACGGGDRYSGDDVAATLEEGTIFDGVDSVEQLKTRCQEGNGEGWNCTVEAPNEERRYRVWVDADGTWAAVEKAPDRGGNGTFGCCLEPRK